MESNRVADLLKFLGYLSIIFLRKVRLLFFATAGGLLFFLSPQIWSCLEALVVYSLCIPPPPVFKVLIHIVQILCPPRGLSWLPKRKLALSHALYPPSCHFSIILCLIVSSLPYTCHLNQQTVKTVRPGASSVSFHVVASVHRSSAFYPPGILYMLIGLRGAVNGTGMSPVLRIDGLEQSQQTLPRGTR